MVTSRCSVLTLMIAFMLLPTTMPLLAASKAIDLRDPRLLAKRAGPGLSLNSGDVSGKAAFSPNGPNKGNLTAQTSQAGEPFECTFSVTDASGTFTFYTRYPWDLNTINWTGGGRATCTIPMVSISYNLFSVSPDSRKHTIADGKCPGCANLVATNTNYKCTQGLDECDGDWKVGYNVIFEVAPPNVFNTGWGSCVVAGATATCTETVDVGTAPKYNLVLPEGFTNAPLLTPMAIANIRNDHFVRPDGTVRDTSKGVFDSSKTDADLQWILEQGMKDPAPWGPATAPTYRLKHWGLAGQGRKSLNSPPFNSDGMDLVIDNGGNVITMYPT
ncbi:hypothetical protein E1B28_000125 [Marasmius oreades]|uniref:Uncharacterized protein n=1 Tax=Marasmius oreades TaxID=181124 RepID=A0A9P7V0M0_9AGAR|nr:uncharacterized protein E1B28_000125 [Marasmius oreades]KAG7098155.1 hypothetical protein E1B28_000125 [Marasmius oreades]